MDDEEDPVGPAIAEVNRIEAPRGHCQWDTGCTEPATHNLVQYNSKTGENLVDGGVDANYCEAHSHAMKARLEEWE